MTNDFFFFVFIISTRFSLIVLFIVNECLLFDQTTHETKALSTLIKILKFPCLPWKSSDSYWRNTLSLETLSDRFLFSFTKSSNCTSKVLACLLINHISPLFLNAEIRMLEDKTCASRSTVCETYQ